MKSAQEFVDLIGAKGGVIEALDQGLSTEKYDLPRDMAETWVRMSVIFEKLAAQMDIFNKLVDDYGLERE